MSTIPFKKFIIMFLLFNKNTTYIIDKLKDFGYFIKEQDIVDILNELRTIMPPSLSEILNANGIFDSTNELHIQWLQQLGVFEFYDFTLRKDKGKDPPNYFNWCQNCLWIHGYKDIMCLINILLFNEESFEEISDIISFKYKKKIGIECLKLYKEIFWDTNNLTAKEALEYCIPFKDSALIIRKLRSGQTEIYAADESDNGSDVPITFHNTNYIKWKIGYKKVEVPTAKDFLNQIKTDSYFKYYEAMNMTRSVDSEDESGDNMKFGTFSRNLSIKKNVEEQRVKIVRNWFDIFLKANEAMPEGGADTKGFFEKMQQLELDFGEVEDEKIVRIEDVPHILEDIKGDMSP